MKVPPLSKRPLNADDEHISSQQAAHDGFGGDRDDSNGHPTGMGARAQSWMHTDAVGWGIRVAIVSLFVGGFYAVYINGVAEGWWRAWGETPTVAATTTPTTPLPPRTLHVKRATNVGRLRDRPRRRPRTPGRTRGLNIHKTRTARRSHRKHRKRRRGSSRTLPRAPNLCLEYWGHAAPGQYV